MRDEPGSDRQDASVDSARQRLVSQQFGRTAHAVARRLERRFAWLCYRSYPTAKLFHTTLLRFGSRRKGTPILVYQMGKVASQTVVATLAQAGLSSPIFHLHVLTRETMEDDERRYRANWTKDGTANHLWTSQHVKRRLEADPDAQWHIVTLTRDPIARNISMFFQVSQHWLALETQRRRHDEDPGVFFEELRRRFLDDFSGHDFPDIWFDAELRRFFGIDVYDEPFATDRGYQIYRRDGVHVLLIRVEDLRPRAVDAFRDFLGVEIRGGLRDANIAGEKHYAAIYRQFVESVELPSPYVARMYESRYARHFYAQEELDAFRRRWTASRS